MTITEIKLVQIDTEKIVLIPADTRVDANDVVIVRTPRAKEIPKHNLDTVQTAIKLDDDLQT